MSLINSAKSTSITPMMKVSFWYTFSNFMQKFIVVLSVPIITRMITASEYGMYSVYGSWFEILYNLCTLALASGGYFVGMKKHADKKGAYDSTICILCFVITIICFGLFAFFPDAWKSILGLPITFQLPMIIGIITGCPRDFWAAGERYELRCKKLVLVTLITSVGVLISQVVCVKYASFLGMDGTLAVIWGGVIPSVVAGFPIFISILHKGKKIYNPKIWKETLKFNVILIPYYMSITFLNQIDRVMIERFVDAAHAGYYSVAYRAASTINILTVALNQSLMPWIFQKIKAREEKEIFKISSFILVAPLAISVLMVLLAPEIIMLLSGSEYLTASGIIPAVAIGMCLRFISQVFIDVELYYEKNTIITITTICVSILNIGLNYYAIPRYGFLSAGYTTLICFVIQAFIHSIIVHFLTKNQRLFNMRYIWTCAVITIVAGIILSFIYEYSNIRYLIFIVLLLCVCIKRRFIYSRLLSFIDTKSKGKQE